MKPLRELAESMDRLLGLAERHWLVPADIENIRELVERAESAEADVARVSAALITTSTELSMARRNLDAVIGSVDGVTESVIADRDKARDRIASLEAQLASAREEALREAVEKLEIMAGSPLATGEQEHGLRMGVERLKKLAAQKEPL